jgi:hypothetical protein
MLKHKTVWLAIVACALPPWLGLAQTLPASGLYQIISGKYSECCGIAGDTVVPLPNAAQAFIRLTVDSNNGFATMTFLGGDGATVFHRVPCMAPEGFDFSFPYGFPVSGSFEFHVDPGPPPLGLWWNYTASDSVNQLRVDGALGILQTGCADVPNRFGHSAIMAVLVAQPRLSVVGLSTNHAFQVMIQGTSGRTNILQASPDLKSWTSVSTNVMDNTDCAICPFFIFEDSESTNLVRRFYRAIELE